MRRTFQFISVFLFQTWVLTVGSEAVADNRDPGDSSPIEIAEGSPIHFHVKGGFSPSPGGEQASANQYGYNPLLFALDGCTTIGTCAWNIGAGWSADLYDAAGQMIDHIGDSGNNIVTVENKSHESLVNDGHDHYGPGVRHSHSAHFSYAMVMPQGGATAQKLPCPPKSSKCKMIVSYCRGKTMPVSGHPDMCQ